MLAGHVFMLYIWSLLLTFGLIILLTKVSSPPLLTVIQIVAIIVYALLLGLWWGRLLGTWPRVFRHPPFGLGSNEWGLFALDLNGALALLILPFTYLTRDAIIPTTALVMLGYAPFAFHFWLTFPRPYRYYWMSWIALVAGTGLFNLSRAVMDLPPVKPVEAIVVFSWILMLFLSSYFEKRLKG
jgi:hypothetical protein